MESRRFNSFHTGLGVGSDLFVTDVSATPAASDYERLPDNIVIFICTFDPFDGGIPLYTFYCTCGETGHRLKLNDGPLRISLNTGSGELGSP